MAHTRNQTSASFQTRLITQPRICGRLFKGLWVLSRTTRATASLSQQKATAATTGPYSTVRESAPLVPWPKLILNQEYFLSQNAKKIPGAIDIKLENVLIGNGWFDPLIQYQAYYNFTISPGNTYDYDPYNASVKAEWYNNLYGTGNCVDQTKECYATGRDDICANADSFCANKVENLFDIYSGRDEYDMRELMPDPFPYGFYVEYLNSPKVQAAIGAYQNFSESSSTVGNAFSNTGDDDREVGTIEDVQKLLEAGVQVVMYFGDA